MLTDKKTLDALKEMNYKQVYEQGIKSERERILEIVSKGIMDWAVKLGIYKKPELVNISDTIDLEVDLKQQISEGKAK